MKILNVVLIILFQLLSLSVGAQSLFYKSQSEILHAMAKESDWTFNMSGRNNKGEPYLSYEFKAKGWDKTFYFKGDSCGLIIMYIPNEQLSDIIIDLNSKYISEGNNLWLDDKAKIQYALILTENRQFFEVLAMPLALLDYYK